MLPRTQCSPPCPYTTLFRSDLVSAEGQLPAVFLRVDALDASAVSVRPADGIRLEIPAASFGHQPARDCGRGRSEEHTPELQPPCKLVCRTLIAKKHHELHKY